LFDYLVFIGRFQPFHVGHLAVIQTALAQSQKVILLIGSAKQPRSTRNVFNVDERVQMVLSAFSIEDAARIHCVPLVDILYDDVGWVNSVKQAVESVTGDDQLLKVGLVGHYKDQSSYYLSLFPNWQPVSVESYRGLSATPIRNAYLLGKLPTIDHVPASTLNLLSQFMQSVEYQQLQEEARYIVEYKKSWASAPYAPTFVTVDAVVVHGNHILLVERGDLPGKGLYALAGGFLDSDETLFNACLRELREETNVSLSDADWRAAYQSQQTFDEPHRSVRGRSITQGFYFKLNDALPRPQVLGGDDAKRAFWLPLSELRTEQMFEDHYAIINQFVKINPT
jgi:bifunctional NMN adenylyltransferase/nudix hydrolase